MGEPVERAGRGSGSLFRSALASLLNLGRRLGRVPGRALRAAGAWLARGVTGIAGRFWAFLGRCGLALRHLLTLLLWRPLAWIGRPFVRAGKALWAFLGRCGLALRHLLTLLIWRPLLFVSRPFRWLYGKILRRPLAFAALSLRTFGDWLFRELLPGLVRGLLAGLVAAPRWLALAIRGRISAWRVRRRVKAYDLDDVLAPAPRRLRLRQVTTAVVAAGLILLLGLLSSQEQRALNVSAGAQRNSLTRPAVARLVPKMTLTPTPLPSPTPMPTASPTPIIVSAPELWPTPDPLSKGGSVVFSSRQEGNGDLFALTLGRSAPIRLTAHPADDRDPAWSPDGRYLAFSSRRDGNWELYILDLFSGQLRRLTDNPAFDGGPNWSPDGQWLVFESYRDDNLDLYIIAADGQDPPIRLTENPAHDFSPAWSPDGRHIAFASWRDGNQDIFLLSLDAAYDDQALNASQTPDRLEDHPVFSPGGDLLAYDGRGDGLDLIYTMPLEAYRPAGPASSVGQGRHPSWSPDGRSLIYAHWNGLAHENGLAHDDDVNGQSYIIASSADSWNVAPQAYAGTGPIADLAWSGAILPRDVESRLPVDEVDAEPLFQERMSANDRPASFMLQEIDVDAPAPYLSDRVDDSFAALRQRVLDEAGWDFLGRLDNMFIFLTANPVPGDVGENWHKAARAFDFSYREAVSVDPQVEIVREDLGSATYWRVYVRTAHQDGSQGEPLRQMPWDFTARYEADPRYYDQGGKLKETLPAGYYLDFTALAADYGWQRAPALVNWRTFFHGIRYWHFESRQGLAWSDALLELYTADELDQANSRR